VLKFTTLASGSSGNAAVISCGGTHVLLDAGISARRITTGLKALGLEPEDLSGVLITHDHSDHIGGVTVLSKKLKAPIFATCPTCRTIAAKAPCAEGLLRELYPGEEFGLGALTVLPFATSHDTPGSVGYSLLGGGSRMVLCTDLGYVSREVEQAVRGCDLLVCEANHDPDWVMTGPYPYYLKQRVLGDRGHLSNEAGAELALYAARNGTKEIILAHLSAENNTPAHAMRVVSDHLRRGGVDLEGAVRLTIAPRAELGQTCFVCREREENAV
jgi:phosphoribosyl 1,2-cyclic phosphodiesterase